MTAPRPAPRGPLLRRDDLLLLAAALAVSLVVVVPPLHWALRVDLLPFLVPALLDPRSGWYSLTVVLCALVLVPRVLGQLPVEPVEEELPPPRSPGGGTLLPVPDGPPRRLDAEQRQQACRALDVPWRPELATDDADWERIYTTALDAAARRADGPPTADASA